MLKFNLVVYPNPQTRGLCETFMPSPPYFIDLEEAREISHQYLPKISEEIISLDEASNRILSEDLESLVDDPPFDNSAMDGFAVRYEDSSKAPVTLKITQNIQAQGLTNLPTIMENEACSITTGAPMPKGSDAIIPIEKCQIENGQVTLLEPSKPNFIRKRGENITKGDVGLFAGARLTPSRISLCATMGYQNLKVIKPLTIAIISTGNELKSPGESLEFGEIYESNSFGLASLVKLSGHIPKRYESVMDSMDSLRSVLNDASQSCDVILTSGGVSMGEYDYVRKIMEEEGDIKFWRVKLRPGSPPLFGLWDNTPLFGLPGNPVSSHVVFLMLTKPWLMKATGADGPIPKIIHAKLMDSLKSTKDCLTLRRLEIKFTQEGVLAYQPRHQGSGNIESLASADALSLLKPNQSGEIGEEIEVMLL